MLATGDARENGRAREDRAAASSPRRREDPAISVHYAAAYVRGLQQPYDGSASGSGSHHHNRLKLAACCKHFTAYDLDNLGGTDRFHFNTVVGAQDLEDTFNVLFRACVADGRAASVMCSYNQVNGKPTCAEDAVAATLRAGLDLQQLQLAGGRAPDDACVLTPPSVTSLLLRGSGICRQTRAPDDAAAASRI